MRRVGRVVADLLVSLLVLVALVIVVLTMAVAFVSLVGWVIS